MGRTWAPKGKTPRIEYNFNWKKLSAMAGITLDGKIYFRVHECSIKKEQVIQYLGQLLRHIKGYIVILWDGSSAHRAKDVTHFLDEHKDRISAYRIPPYSPDFNPVEWLWAEIKWGKMKGYCPKKLEELRRKLYSCVRSLRNKAALVRSYFDASSLPPIGKTSQAT